MNNFLKIAVLILGCGFSSQAQDKEVVISSSNPGTPVVVDTVRIARPRLIPVRPKTITKELTFGLRLNTDGWGFYSNFCKVKPVDQKHPDNFHNLLFYEFEIGEKKDPKEHKTPSGATNRFGGSSTYKYGKINSLYTVKLGAGFQKLLAGKPDTGCVALHWVNTAGFSLGVLKPYYLNVDSDPHTISFSDATEESFLDQRSIEGYAGFSQGLNEAKFVPGGYLRTALNFDFSTNNHNVLGLQVGVTADIYSQKMQLMASSLPARLAYYSLFIAAQFGKRW